MNKKNFEQFLRHKENGIVTFNKTSNTTCKVSLYAEDKCQLTYTITDDFSKCEFSEFYDSNNIREIFEKTKSKNHFYILHDKLIEEITPAKTVKKDADGNVIIPDLTPKEYELKTFNKCVKRYTYRHTTEHLFKENFFNDKSEFIKMMKHSQIESGTLDCLMNNMAIYTESDTNKLIFRGASPYYFLKLKWPIQKENFLDCIILNSNQVQHLFLFLNYKEEKNIEIVVNKKIIYFIDSDNGDEINFFYERNPYFKNWDVESVLKHKKDICDVEFKFAKKKNYRLIEDAHAKVVKGNKDDLLEMNIGLMDSFALTLNDLELNPYHQAIITKNEKEYPILYKQEDGYTLIMM